MTPVAPPLTAMILQYPGCSMREASNCRTCPDGTGSQSFPVPGKRPSAGQRCWIYNNNVANIWPAGDER
jgi:hypothetical protein